MLMKLKCDKTLTKSKQRFLLEAQLLARSGDLSPSDPSICIWCALAGNKEFFIGISKHLSSVAGPKAIAKKLITPNSITKENLNYDDKTVMYIVSIAIVIKIIRTITKAITKEIIAII